MNEEIKAGISKEIIVNVSPEDSARAYGSGLLDVYATPAMISLMERTSMEAVQAYLTEGYGTVGIKVNVDHVKATLCGASVVCASTLIEVDRSRLVFKVTVSEGGKPVGSGFHERYIINEQQFLEKLS